MNSIVQTVYHSKRPISKEDHFHDCHQIILILRGQAEFCINGNRHPAQAGDIAIFSRYENHSLEACSPDYERFVLQIDPEGLNHQNPVYALLTDRPQGFRNIFAPGSYLQAMIDIFQLLIREQESKEDMVEEMELLLVRQLLIRIYRCISVDFDGLHDEIVIGVKRQFENHYAEGYTLEALAGQFHLSPSSLSHRFREATGTSVMHYLQSIRIAAAKRLLAESDLGIGQIVEACGFSDISNFTRTFRQQNGLTPSAFRKKFRF